jgi:serine phosphatase RsbU (regulator of sigma subunit)
MKNLNSSKAKTHQPIVIIVDDEEMVTTSIQSILELETNYTIFTFQSPVEAVNYIKNHLPDIIISDFLMPEMNGLEFLTETKAICPDVPRILLTGYADKENAIRAINEVGLYQYIEKPWDNDQLLLIIQNGIAFKSLQRTLKEKIHEVDEILRNRDELLTLNNVFQEELEFAKKMQNKFLPPREISINGIDLYASYIPTLEIGGDYFDVIPLANSRTAVVLVDLTGHGIQASLCTALLKFSFSNFKESAASIEEIMIGMNDILYKGLPHDIFAATILAVFDSERRECEIINGGNPHPLVVKRSKNQVERVIANGLYLGLFNNDKFYPGEKATIQLNDDSSIFLFTDGITEIKDKKSIQVGEKILIEVATQNVTLSSKEIVSKILVEAQKLRLEQTHQDDLTILSVDINHSKNTQ